VPSTNIRPEHSVAIAWREAVRAEALAELTGSPTRPHGRRRDRLARRLLIAGDARRADLIGTPVINRGGREVGHVVELRIGRRHHRVNAILTGSYGWLGRLGIRSVVHRPGWRGRQEEVPWERVEEVRYDRITVQCPSGSAGAKVTEQP
jgi:sporulation protein YlmC with PRC-barrel domain